MPYDLRTIAAPRLAGGSLVMAAAALENQITGAALRPRLMRDAGIERLRGESMDEPPSVAPPLRCPPARAASPAQPPPDLEVVVRDAAPWRSFRSNLTGHPAITFPSGYDSAGMPVGFQAIGRPWEEHLLLRLAEVGESEVERRSPTVHSRLLG